MMAANEKIAKDAPGDVEALLPWHAAGTLSVRGGSSLGSSNRIDDVVGSGAAGSVSINAGTLTLSGAGSEIASITESSGAGGNVNLQGTTLNLSDGARISARGIATAAALERMPARGATASFAFAARDAVLLPGAAA